MDNDLLYTNSIALDTHQGYGMTAELERHKLRAHVEKNETHLPVTTDFKHLNHNDLLNTNRVIDLNYNAQPINERRKCKEERYTYTVLSENRQATRANLFTTPEKYQTILTDKPISPGISGQYMLFKSIFDYFTFFKAFLQAENGDKALAFISLTNQFYAVVHFANFFYNSVELILNEDKSINLDELIQPVALLPNNPSYDNVYAFNFVETKNNVTYDFNNYCNPVLNPSGPSNTLPVPNQTIYVLVYWLNVLVTSNNQVGDSFWNPFYYIDAGLVEYVYNSDPSNYAITLPDYIHNCKSIRLISSEIPNTIPNITGANNVLMLSMSKGKYMPLISASGAAKGYNFDLIQLDVGQFDVPGIVANLVTKLNTILTEGLVTLQASDTLNTISPHLEFHGDFNPESGIIQIKLSNGDTPEMREGAATIYDETNQNLLLFGGRHLSKRFQDTWIWNGSQWTLLDLPSPLPPKRDSALLFQNAGVVYLIGGFNGSVWLNDLWSFDGTKWVELPIRGAFPTNRQDASMCYDPKTNQVVLFGGIQTDRITDIVKFSTSLQNIALITTRLPHGLKIGDTVYITKLAQPYNGWFKIQAVLNDYTFTYFIPIITSVINYTVLGSVQKIEFLGDTYLFDLPGRTWTCIIPNTLTFLDIGTPEYGGLDKFIYTPVQGRTADVFPYGTAGSVTLNIRSSVEESITYIVYNGIDFPVPQSLGLLNNIFNSGITGLNVVDNLPKVYFYVMPVTTPRTTNLSITVPRDSSLNYINPGTPRAINYYVVQPPLYGTAVASGNTIWYTPAPGNTLPDAFTYTATNGEGTSSPSTISITLGAPAALPVPPTITTPSNTLNLITTGFTNITNISSTRGTRELKGNTIWYTSADGDDVIRFTGTNTAGTAMTSTITITIGANVNSYSQYYTTAYNTPVGFTGIVKQFPAHGTILNNNYIPNPGFSGLDYFFTTDTTIVINVLTPLTSAFNIHQNICRNSTTLINTMPALKTPFTNLTTLKDGEFDPATKRYTPPNPGYEGIDSFAYTAADGTTALVTLRIGANPVTYAFKQTIPENTPTALALLYSAPTAPAPTITFTAPLHGTITNSVYTPTAGYVGPDNFTFTIGNSTSSVSLTIQPTPVVKEFDMNVTIDPLPVNLLPLLHPGPQPRGKAAMAFDGQDVVLFGGLCGTLFQNDTWIFRDNTWTQIQTPGPSPRGDAAVCSYLPGQLILFGGLYFGDQAIFTYYQDTWIWKAGTWTQVRTTSPTNSYTFDGLQNWIPPAPTRPKYPLSMPVFPPVSSHATLCFNPIQNAVLLFGGFAGENASAACWTFRSHVWIEEVYTFHLKFYSVFLNTGGIIYDVSRTAYPSTTTISGYTNELWYLLGFSWPCNLDNTGLDIYATELNNCIRYMNNLLNRDNNSDDVFQNTPNIRATITANGDNLYLRPSRYPDMGTRYINLVMKGYKNMNQQLVNNNSSLEADIFTKVLLNVPTGQIAYNTYVDNPFIFTNLTDVLKTLNFQWVDQYGNFVDFGGIEHSFTLEFIKYTSHVDVNDYNTKMGQVDTSSYPDYLVRH